MGLDVFIIRGYRSDSEMEEARRRAEEDGEEIPSEFKPVTWRHCQQWGDFPFTPTTEEISEYDRDEQYVGSHPSPRFIGEITGPMYIDFGCLSFRGRGYSDLAGIIGLPYSFYGALSAEQVAEQTEMLGKWLASATGPDGQPIMERLTWRGHEDPEANERWLRSDFQRLQHLHTLLSWMVKHHLETYASF